MIKQCLYASRALCEFSPTALDALLDHARERNHARELTGLLVYGHGGFVQVVEGPEEAVDALFSRIARDPRHEVLMHTTRPVDTRHFPEWRMGYVRLDLAHSIAPNGFLDLLDADVELASLPGLDPLARALIEGLRTADRQSAGGVPA